MQAESTGLSVAEGSPKGGHRVVLELDGVRGLAVLFVVLFHCMPGTGHRYVDAVLALRHSLWIGVDLFFVLSGFLISGILLDQHACRNRYSAFFARRTLRIFPLYYLVLLLIFGAGSMLPEIQSELNGSASLGWFAGYGFNIWLAIHGGWPSSELLNHFWSLCVEEQFYLFWPVAVYSLRVVRFPLLACGAVLIATLLKVWIVFSGGSPITAFVSMPCRMDAFALGGLAAYASRFWSIQSVSKWAFWLLVASGLGVCAVALPNRCLSFELSGSVLPGSSLVAIMFASFIFLCVHPVSSTKWMQLAMRCWALRILGRYSYGIYIYHWLIQYSLIRRDVFGWGQHSPWLGFLVVILVTGFVSVLSFHLFEAPLLKLKRYARFSAAT